MSFVFVLVGVSFVQPIFYSQVAYADPLAPNCTSGILTGNSESNLAEITLTCTNLAKFSRNGATESNESIDLSRIRLNPARNTVTLRRAIINVGQLVLQFRIDQPDGLFDRGITIDAGTFSDNSDPDPITNSLITISSGVVLDQTIPYVENDYYSTSGGVLNVSAGGVLTNDRDTGSTLTINTYTNTLNGVLDLRADGSFTYTPGPGFTGDSFTYTAVDSAGNFSSAATVTIGYEAPTVNGIFYKISGGNSGYVKVGDIVRVDFAASGTVTCVSAVIATNAVICQTIDETHFYIDYVMQSTDTEGYIYYSATYNDLAGNIYTYSPPID